MTRCEHLEWAKGRAIAYADAGDLQGAFASFASDLRKHIELETHPGITLLFQLYIGKYLNSPKRIKEVINGFN